MISSRSLGKWWLRICISKIWCTLLYIDTVDRQSTLQASINFLWLTKFYTIAAYFAFIKYFWSVLFYSKWLILPDRHDWSYLTGMIGPTWLTLLFLADRHDWPYLTGMIGPTWPAWTLLWWVIHRKHFPRPPPSHPQVSWSLPHIQTTFKGIVSSERNKRN